jgi:hypothetical protein
MTANHRIEKLRAGALIEIHDQRQEIEEMAQRAASCGDHVDEALLSDVRANLAAIAERATLPEITTAGLEALERDAHYQGQLSAYLCPQREIADEGSLCLDELEEWNVPKAVIAKLRTTLGDKISRANEDVAAARSALRALFEEYDSWDGYTDNYESTMDRTAFWLLVALAVALPCSLALAHWPSSFPAALILAGLSGSFISILSKMPALEVAFAGELSSYLRKRVLIRIAVGVGASIIGSALLSWGVVSIAFHGTSYAEVVLSCTAAAGSCDNVKQLVLIAVPLLFGLSERALTSFESKVVTT